MTDALTAGQVAKILGVNRATVWKWRKRGLISASEIYVPGSRVWVYARKEVEVLRKRLRSGKPINH